MPQLPPQPLGPHCLPLHCGAQHVPEPVQVWPPGQGQSAAQFWQFSPAWQALLPHTLSSTQAPALHELPDPQVPQLPPQPSDPHCFPAQSGVQHAEPKQLLPPGHAQSAAHELQFSPLLDSHWPLPQFGAAMQLPLSHCAPAPQLPQLPPQPSGPQSLPEHCGLQHTAFRHAPPPQSQSVGQLSQFSLGSHCVSPQLAWTWHTLPTHAEPDAQPPQSRA